MSCSGRKKHTQILLKAMNDKRLAETAAETMVRRRRRRPPPRRRPSRAGLAAAARRSLCHARALMPTCAPQAATEQTATAGASKDSQGVIKEWLPAYLSDDRHEATELLTMVQRRRKDDGTFFTGL